MGFLESKYVGREVDLIFGVIRHCELYFRAYDGSEVSLMNEVTN